LDVTDPRYKDNPEVKAWKAFTDKYMSAAQYIDANAAYAFGAAATMIQVLKQCGSDLSRENVMKQAANLNKFAAPLLIPGITINTSPDVYDPIRQLQLLTFNGTSWEPSGGILQG
ncbi:MAG TPA: branched-chain amino acid ABC transporter substrate-binding protein, partial [Roseiarcus sp.]|nr:branched-chain amino acid ABC transporter substrate-binding protein [Roseiarcus sp.]